MEHQTAYLHVDFKQQEGMEFDRKRMRRAFVQIGRVYMKEARQQIMKRGRSAPGENPGYQTGQLARSIGYRVPSKTSRRPGMMVKISPNQKNGQGNRRFPEGVAYYPAFLFYGVHQASYRMSKKDKRKKRHHDSPWRIAPRKNFMATVIDQRRYWTQKLLAGELQRSLRPVKGKNI